MSTRIDTASDHVLPHERNAVDVIWEHCQEQALRAFMARDMAKADAAWAKALDLAERHFERGDPRLAASRSNRAYALLRQDQGHRASALFNQALTAWDDAWRWVPLMAPALRPGDSEAEPYDRETQRSFYALIRRGKAMTETMCYDRRLPEACADDWASVKPARMNDVRRLFAAIFLMPAVRRP